MTWDRRATGADWQLLTRKLSSARVAVLGAHAEPDADALGSALAVGLALAELGVEACVSYPGLAAGRSAAVLPASLSWLPAQEMLVPVGSLPRTPDVAVSFDVSSLDRLGDLAEVMGGAEFFAAVDHHQSFSGFSDLAIVDPEAPATAVLALQLIDRLGVDVSRDMAECLYAGLITDTGSFQFPSTTSATHEMAARLHAVGVRHDEIARALLDSKPFPEMKLLASALRRAVHEPAEIDGLGIVWTHVPKADRAEMGLDVDSVELVIEVLRRTRGAEVTAVLKEGDDGMWRVSLRSRGRFDVGSVCAGLGGGGHRAAGGYTALDSTGAQAESIMEVLRARLRESGTTGDVGG